MADEIRVEEVTEPFDGLVPGVFSNRPFLTVPEHDLIPGPPAPSLHV